MVRDKNGEIIRKYIKPLQKNNAISANSCVAYYN